MAEICLHCGREFESDSGGFKNHKRACGNRPSDDELLADYETLTMAQMADKYEVSRHSVSRWLKTARAGEQHRRNGSADELEVYIKLAPFYGRVRPLAAGVHPTQLAKIRSVCALCGFLPFCQDLALQIGWVLCEAPDKKQLERWAGAGIDPEKIVKALGVAELVENASCTNS